MAFFTEPLILVGKEFFSYFYVPKMLLFIPHFVSIFIIGYILSSADTEAISNKTDSNIFKINATSYVYILIIQLINIPLLAKYARYLPKRHYRRVYMQNQISVYREYKFLLRE